MTKGGTLLPFVGDMSDGSSCRERTSGIYSTGIAERRELGRLQPVNVEVVTAPIAAAGG